MGQTLTHGVYLPSEGERNCYSGLASNWRLLNGAIGTVAAHTTAIAEKAPLVHTHGKADITDFPAYGTTAGTICEGNDSRLSDARTPVAHTHTKSDVTNLLNSDFIPSANNAYDLGSSSYQWKTLNGINPGALSLPDYSRTMDIDTTNWSKDGNKIIYTPTVNGWLQITIPNDDNNGIKSNKIAILDSGTNPYSGIVYGNSNDPRIYCSFPVIANRKYWIYIKSYSNTITTARIVQCLGNV